MSDRFSAASAASISDSSEPECELCGNASRTTTAAEFSRDTGPESRATRTCENSQEPPSNPSMSSAEDSPARIFPTPAGVRESTGHARVFGQSTPVSLASFDPATSSWRTSQLSLLEEWAEFSETWPRAGMTRSGTAFPLVPLARPTGVIGSGSWPTPDASVAQDGEKPDTWLARREREKLKGQNGNGMGMPLTIAVQMWPTIRATDADRGGRGDLIQAVRGNSNPHFKQWPTPTTQDAANDGGPSQFERNSLPLNAAVKWRTPSASDALGGPMNPQDRLDQGHTLNLKEQVWVGGGGGSLNPTWVEWLMNFPLGWTEVD